MNLATGVFSWSMAAGLLAFSSRQFAPTINYGPPCPPHIIFLYFLPDQAQLAANAARGAKRLVHPNNRLETPRCSGYDERRRLKKQVTSYVTYCTSNHMIPAICMSAPGEAGQALTKK